MEGLLARARTEDKRADLEQKLAVPPCPPAMRYLFDRFLRLSERRQNNGFGASRITYLEMDAFQRVTGFRLQPWEVRLIERLDDAFLIANAPKKGE